MGKIEFNHNKTVFNTSPKQIVDRTDNYRVAMWQIPYDSRYSDYDTDNSKWFEATNEVYENEIENVEKELHISLNKYKTYTETIEYDDESVTETSEYPNGNQVKVNKTPDFVMVEIKDKDGNIVAEKFYNYEDNKGRKNIYKHVKQGDNTFTVVRIFSYDTTKNRSTDIINYGYTSEESKLTNGCILEKEYYMLNGKQVKAVNNKNGIYSVKDKQGKILTFRVE